VKKDPSILKDASILQVFGSQKMAAILALGFASGLPYALTNDVLKGWLTNAKLDLSTIGWFGLVALPYTLKFLWSPVLDRFVPPFLGRRRGWMLLAQIGLVIGVMLLALQMSIIPGLVGAPRSVAIQAIAATAMVIVFLSATQDIAVDAYRTDVLEERETGAGASLSILGYRIALLVGGWLAFNLADTISWHWVYVLMAGLLALISLTSFWAPEPIRQERPPETFEQAVVLPFKEFFGRLGGKAAIFTLLFVILFRIGDAMVANLAVPFLGELGLGFSNATIGNIRQGMGLISTIVGTLMGGAALSKLGINRSLWLFGTLQAVSNISYYLLAVVGKNYPAMVAAINIENFCSGLGTAGFVGFLMSLCNARFSATQFALLSSLMAVGRDLIANPSSGIIAQRIQEWVAVTPDVQSNIYLAGTTAVGKGWALYFLVTLLAALPGLLLLPIFAPWNPRPEASMPRPGMDDE
jgi:MFS transporter, PAT family, beta-lactamase induction signal transducer AmpG